MASNPAIEALEVTADRNELRQEKIKLEKTTLESQEAIRESIVRQTR